MKAFYKRQFLNLEEHGGTAFFEASVSELKNGGYIDARFKVADCSRIVDLDFDVYTDDGHENVRAKLRRFTSAVRAFEKALLERLDGR